MSHDTEHQPLLSGPVEPDRVPKINMAGWYYPDMSRFHASGKAKCRHFLSSKPGHYSVLILVCLDVFCIFADFLINLFVCEGHLHSETAEVLLEVLDWSGLTFSGLFMLELLASIWAFGGSFFGSYFHCFDAFIIVFGFTLDIILKGGTIEEAASLIIVLRLWRVFKIIEELSVGAQEQAQEAEIRIQHLQKEIEILKSRLATSSNTETSAVSQ